MKKIFLFVNLILSAPVAFCGSTGTIQGKIIDAATGEELIGAAVVISETTTGTISDFDGNYALSNLSPGTYVIDISYVSYQTLSFTDVTVEAGSVTTLNGSLSEAVTELEAVEVVAEARQRNEVALQVLQMKSATILDGISAQQISKLGYSHAAGALRRVTGVSVQDDKYVYVRGLSDRFMKITLNNAEVPGLDPNFNTVQMDLFPSNIIETMTVAKTYTPDKPSYTAGLVNVITKDFPSKFMFDASAGAEINTNTHFNDHYLRHEGGKLEWLAMEDGTRAIPAAVDGIDIPRPGNNTADEVRAYSLSFNKILSTEETRAPVNQGYSLSFGDQKRIFNNKYLGYIAAISYKSESAFHDDGRLDDYTVQSAGSISPDELLSETMGSYSATWSALAGLNYKISNNNKIGINFLRTQNGTSYSRFYGGATYHSDSYNLEKTSLEYLYRSLTVGQISGTQILPGSNNIKLEWLSSYTRSVQNTPDLRFFITEIVENNGTLQYDVRDNRKPERRYREMEETNWDTKFDITIPVQNVIKLKIGGSYLQKLRNSSENRFTIQQLTAIDFNGDPSDYVKDENFVDADDPFSGLYYDNDYFDNSYLSYNAEDKISAGYLMGDILFAGKFRLALGGRVEYGSMFIENNVDTLAEDIRPSQKALYRSGNSEDLDFLPAVNLKFEPVRNMNLRLGYSRSLTRPSFRERSPYEFYEYTEGTTIVGEPALKHGLVDNFDFRWEYFFKPGEMFSVSLFYKYIYDMIERYKVSGTGKLTKYRNGEDATLYGTEIEFRKRLDFISLLRDFSLGTNLSFDHSETKVDSARYARAIINVPDFPATRPLYGQAPYILNAYLLYENEKSGLYTNISFNVSGPKIVFLNIDQTPDVYEQPYPRLDLNIGKRFLKSFSVEVAVSNILNPKFRQNITLENGDMYPFREYSEGRSFGVRLSYSLK